MDALIRSRASQELNDQNTTVFERSDKFVRNKFGRQRVSGKDATNQLRSISFSSEMPREPVRASIGLAFLGSFFWPRKK